MDYRKSNAPSTTVTRNLDSLNKGTNNIYETVIVVSRRANQIAVEMKQELNKSLRNLHPILIIWKRYLKIANRLKFQSFTKDFPNLR